MLSFHFVVMAKKAKYAYDVNAPAVRAGLLFLVCVFFLVCFFFFWFCAFFLLIDVVHSSTPLKLLMDVLQAGYRGYCMAA